MTLINIVHKNYYRLPNWMINSAGALYNKIPEIMRYGEVYKETRKLLNTTEYLSEPQICEINNALFLKTVHHAYNHVPFYRNKYNEYGVDIDAIKDIRDIQLLPTISKEDLRIHKNEMIADDYDKSRLMYITTSGSTGNPVGFYQEANMTMKEWAYTLHIWSRVGYKQDSSRLVLRGKKIHPKSPDPDLFFDPLRKELSCNIFNMTDETMGKYCLAIEKYKPQFIHGYMSSILMLSRYIEARGKKLDHQFEGILATSETIIKEQRQYIERVLNTRIFSFYGHSERLIIAGECEKSSSYHIEPLYGYCEIIDQKGEISSKGEIIATGFLNEAMPLIRYHTGDMAAWDECLSCSCGRKHLRISEVLGRWNQDMLVNAEGTYISMTALNIHSSDFDKLIRYKLIQYKPGEVYMKIMSGDLFTSADALKIKRLLEYKTDKKIDFIIEVVADLPIQKNGKYKIVEQHIELGNGQCEI